METEGVGDSSEIPPDMEEFFFGFWVTWAIGVPGMFGVTEIDETLECTVMFDHFGCLHAAANNHNVGHECLH